MGEEFLNLAAVAEKLKQPKLQKQFADQCLKNFGELKALSQLRLARSSQQYMVPCYEFAGRFKEAERALKDLIKIYPAEPTFYLRLARVYRKQKQFDKALGLADEGLKVAYGYNWFTGILLKTDILLDLKRAKDADNVIREALSEVQLNADPASRNQTLAGRLRAAQLKISSANLH
jgi:tetratricopeptide (TPR) repeat protein